METAIELAPAHLSHYQLALEPGTPFYYRPPTLPDDDATWEMQVGCQERLRNSGYHQYEVSAYAQTGFECRHNRNYWQFGDYLGLGAGAHGKWTDVSEQMVCRTERIRQPREYLAKISAAERVTAQRTISQDDLPFEFMLNALRLNEGFDCSLFETRTGLPMKSIAPIVTRASELGLMEIESPETFRATASGRQYLNDLQSMFIPSSSMGRSSVEKALSTPS